MLLSNSNADSVPLCYILQYKKDKRGGFSLGISVRGLIVYEVGIRILYFSLSCTNRPSDMSLFRGIASSRHFDLVERGGSREPTSKILRSSYVA